MGCVTRDPPAQGQKQWLHKTFTWPKSPGHICFCQHHCVCTPRRAVRLPWQLGLHVATTAPQYTKPPSLAENLSHGKAEVVIRAHQAEGDPKTCPKTQIRWMQRPTVKSSATETSGMSLSTLSFWSLTIRKVNTVFLLVSDY